MISKQKSMIQGGDNQGGNSAMVKELEKEIEDLKKRIDEITAKEVSFDSELESMTKRYEREAQTALDLQQKINDLSTALVKSRSEFQDQQCLRRELELELESVLTDRYGMLEERQNSKDLGTQIADLTTKLNSSERKRKQLESISERTSRENIMLKTRCQDFLKIQSENTNLTLRLNELKSRGPITSDELRIGGRAIDSIELSKRNLNALVSNAYNLEDALKASRNRGMLEVMGLNNKYKLMADLIHTKGSVQCLVNMAFKVYQVILSHLAVEDFDALNFVRDPIEGIQRVLGILDSEYANRLAELIAIDEQLCALKEKVKPLEMSWESSTENVSASMEKKLSLYGTSSSLPTVLHWTYSGEAAKCIALSVSYSCPPFVDKVSKLRSISKPGRDGSPIFSGSYSIDEPHGDINIIIMNESIWSDASIAYHFGLSSESIEDNEQVSHLIARKTAIDENLRSLQTLIDSSKDVLQRLSKFVVNLRSAVERGCRNGRFCDGNDLMNTIFNQLTSNSLHLIRLIGSINSGNNCKKIESYDKLDSGDGALKAEQQEELSEEVTTFSNSCGVVSYSAESVQIKAQSDMRIIIPPQTGRVRVSWDFEVLGKGTIGFTIGKALPDGQVPLLLPYFRTKEKKTQSSVVGFESFDLDNLTTLIVIFDNTFSWINSKHLRYVLTVENFCDISATAMNLPFRIRQSSSSTALNVEQSTEDGHDCLLEQNQNPNERDSTPLSDDRDPTLGDEVKTFIEICTVEIPGIESSIFTMMRHCDSIVFS